MILISLTLNLRRRDSYVEVIGCRLNLLINDLSLTLLTNHALSKPTFSAVVFKRRYSHCEDFVLTPKPQLIKRLALVPVRFKHGSHATISLFIFALDSKSFLKDHSIVLKTKEIICFNARTNL